MGARSQLRRWLVLVLAISGLLLIWLAIDLLGWERQRDELERRYGIEIRFDDIVFPDSWRGYEVRYESTPLVRRRAQLDALAVDLARYRSSFLKRYLKRINIVKTLAIQGYHYGGTTAAKEGWLYLEAAWLGDDDAHQEAMGFHHEFSSLLMRAHPAMFDVGEWSRLNAPGFQYRFSASSLRNLSEGDSGLVGNPDLYQQGFLCGYGQATAEDDMNTFAEYLIAKSERLNRLSYAYPAIARKAARLAEVYARIGYSATLETRAGE